MSMSDQMDEITAELFAADVARHLAVIASSQHRISVAICSKHRQAVLRHLRDLGITEQAAAAYANTPLKTDDIQRIVALLEAVETWRPEMLSKIRSLAIST